MKGMISQAQAEQLRDEFASAYGKGYCRAVETLRRDWDRMVTFYRFPKEHWAHIRTTNMVESPFASLRLRTDAAKRYKKVENATAVIWKMLLIAETRFRRLNAPEVMKKVYEGVEYKDGMTLARLLSKGARPIRQAARLSTRSPEAGSHRTLESTA